MYNKLVKIRHAPIAQLDRVFGYEPKGRGFESLLACQPSTSALKKLDYKSGFIFLFSFILKTLFCLMLKKSPFPQRGEGDYFVTRPGQSNPQGLGVAVESLLACQPSTSALKKLDYKSGFIFLFSFILKTLFCLMLKKSPFSQRGEGDYFVTRPGQSNPEG